VATPNRPVVLSTADIDVVNNNIAAMKYHAQRVLRVKFTSINDNAQAELPMGQTREFAGLGRVGSRNFDNSAQEIE
jgi:hypothetical protein